MAYRYQPLFSYALKGAVSERSRRDEIRRFAQAAYESEDDFVHQRGSAALGEPVEFSQKETTPGMLVLKHVRFHHLLRSWLEVDYAWKAVLIVRDPRAVVNSFMNTSREWSHDWKPQDQWRDAPLKNRGRAEEYFGFAKWCEATKLFLELRKEKTEQVFLIQYENLVKSPLGVTERLFEYLGLDVPAQTEKFLVDSVGSVDTKHDYSVKKSPDVAHRWRKELSPEISNEIERSLTDSELAPFLVN